MSCPKIGLHKT